jgi:hypothetical protein
VPSSEHRIRTGSNFSYQVSPEHEPRRLHNHSPLPGDEVPDPEEGDVEEYVSHGPGGRTTFYSQTFTTRSDAFYLHGEPESFRHTHFGGRVGGQQLRDLEAQGAAAEEVRTYASPDSPRSGSGPSFLVISIRARPDQLASFLGGFSIAIGLLLFHPNSEQYSQRGSMPLGLQGLFASLLNPASAVAGDAVYSQEALDMIISAFMEQHPQSNAPGPASEEAIASLPKKNLDEKMLGPELKAECSVCMDDVTVGDEVVVLPWL